MGLVFQWIRKQGGIEEMERRAVGKSQMIYEVINASNNFYCCPVNSNVRSRMNVPFRIGGSTGDEELEKKFLAGAQKLGMLQLKGHR